MEATLCSVLENEIGLEYDAVRLDTSLPTSHLYEKEDIKP